MNERLRALRSVFEQKIAAPIRRSIVDKPDRSVHLSRGPSLQLPTTSDIAEDTSSDVTPTKLQGETPTTQHPPETSQTAEHRKTVSLDTEGCLDTLKKIKQKLSPRCSRKEIEYEDEQTLSESTFEDDEQVIFDAIKNQDYDALIDFMNDDDIDANELTSEGKRYLHECVVYDDKEACEIVLDAGGTINARDIYGWTALHFAAAFCLSDMTQYLLDRGADPRKKTKEGKIPEEITEEPIIEQMLHIARARRGLRSVSTVSISDIEAAQEEFKRRNEERGS